MLGRPRQKSNAGDIRTRPLTSGKISSYRTILLKLGCNAVDPVLKAQHWPKDHYNRFVIHRYDVSWYANNEKYLGYQTKYGNLRNKNIFWNHYVT